MRINFQEVSITATRKWKTPDGKRRQETKKFYQTINPFNKNPDGSVKTRREIEDELVLRRNEWLTQKEGV
jgi:hypothetical protein